MKNIITLLLTIVCSTSIQFPVEKNFVVKLQVDSTLCAEEQMVYMHYLMGNEHYLEDSALISMDVKTVYLYGSVPEQTFVKLFFEKYGPNQLDLVINPGDSINLNLTESDGVGIVYKEVEDSPATTEAAIDWHHSTIGIRGKIRRLEGEMQAYFDRDSIWFANMRDSVEEKRKELIKWDMNIIENSVNPKNVWSALLTPELKTYLGVDSVNNLIKAAQAKFPNHSALWYLSPGNISPPATEKSNRIFEWLVQKKSAKVSTLNEKKKKETASNKVAESGLPVLSEIRGRDALFDFTLTTLEGDSVTLSALRGKYVLVDFWASWCLPCLLEIPFITRAYKEFKEDLVVCPVSIDANHTYWRNAVKKHFNEVPGHLIATNDKGELKDEIERLEIKSIPANYLLDPAGNIIAKDLRGKELIETLKKLLSDKKN